MAEEGAIDSDEMWRSMLLGEYWQFSAGRRLLKQQSKAPLVWLGEVTFSRSARRQEAAN